MKEAQCLLQPVGAVSSLLISLKDCPKQGSEAHLTPGWKLIRFSQMRLTVSLSAVRS